MQHSSKLLGFCVIAGFVICLPIIGLVFPEYAYFYRDYGNNGRPSFALVLQSFGGFVGGWYRPLSITLAPYLLGIDFLNPSSVVAPNIVFFALAAFLAPMVFLPEAPIGTKLLTSSLILSAPALQSVSYFPTIDSLYIIFGMLSIGGIVNAARLGLPLTSLHYVAAVCSLLLAVCAKEVAVLIPFVAGAVIIFRHYADADQKTNSVAFSVLKYCGPLAAASVLFYLVYLINRGIFTPAESYSSVPTSESVKRLIQLSAVSLNVALPGADDPVVRWVTGAWDRTGSWVRIALYILVIAYATLLVVRRRHLVVASYTLVLASLAIPIGVFAIHPHHAYPVIVAIAIAVGASCTALIQEYGRVRQQASPPPLLALMAMLLVALLLLQRAYVHNRDVLLTGRHAFQFRYNTSLFHDSSFKDMIGKRPSFILIEECPNTWSIGSDAGVLNYYAGASHQLGEEYVKDLMLSKVLETRNALETKGGQLVALGCNFANSAIPRGGKPYALINLTEALSGVERGEDVRPSTHRDVLQHLLLREGWFDVESDHVWSLGHRAVLEVPTSPQAKRLTLVLGAYVPNAVVQTIDVSIDGTRVETLRFDKSKSKMVMSWPLEGTAAVRRVEFGVRNPVTPYSASESNDVRELGVSLWGLRVERQ